MALTGNPDKKMLMRALGRRRDNQFDNFFDRLITELFITGNDASHCCAFMICPSQAALWLCLLSVPLLVSLPLLMSLPLLAKCSGALTVKPVWLSKVTFKC